MMQLSVPNGQDVLAPREIESELDIRQPPYGKHHPFRKSTNTHQVESTMLKPPSHKFEVQIMSGQKRLNLPPAQISEKTFLLRNTHSNMSPRYYTTTTNVNAGARKGAQRMAINRNPTVRTGNHSSLTDEI
jgi:hypothetical protein